jgi:hypothetical protein
LVILRFLGSAYTSFLEVKTLDRTIKNSNLNFLEIDQTQNKTNSIHHKNTDHSSRILLILQKNTHRNNRGK